MENNENTRITGNALSCPSGYIRGTKVKRKVAVAHSGGVDSSVLIALLLNNGWDVVPFSFEYGSKHNPYEQAAAKQICEYYNLPFSTIDLSAVFAQMSSHLLKTGGDIPEGHYEHSSMKRTVVPSRNGIFILTLAGIAESKDFNAVALGVHQGDHHIYPDCRPAFIRTMGMAISHQTDFGIELLAPLLELDKQDIVQLGFALSVPFDRTRTCYKDQPKPCGVCGSCNERLEAFKLNGATDPVIYER